MIPALLLALREGLEAALIVGILLGALRKINHEALKSTVWLGTLSAAVVSLLTAVVLQVIGASIEGSAEQIFEGVTMFLAAGVLTWMIFWMRTQAKGMGAALETDVRQAVLQRGRTALFLVAFLAVVREGVELALFLTATAFAAGERATLIGAVAGLGLAVLLAWALFSSLIRLNLRQFFQVTSILLILFAAGLLAHGVHELNEAGWIPVIIEHVWNTNTLVHEDSLPGQILKTLFGYNGNPSLTEVLAYFSYFAVVYLLLRSQEKPVTLPTTAA